LHKLSGLYCWLKHYW